VTEKEGQVMATSQGVGKPAAENMGWMLIRNHTDANRMASVIHYSLADLQPPEPTESNSLSLTIQGQPPQLYI
jgi:hypothetical protein